MLRLAFDFIITWRETRTRPNAYDRTSIKNTDAFLDIGILLCKLFCSYFISIVRSVWT